MKKGLLFLLLTASLLNGCSTINTKNDNQSIKIAWEHAGNLPAQKGFEKNFGTAGMLYGVLDNKYIIVGGGGNFPFEPVEKGGIKKLYSDVYLLEEKNNKLEVVEHINLDNEIGYGASVTTDEGVYYIGGAANEEAANDILFFNIVNNKLNVKKIADLPFTLQDGRAVEKDGKLYIHSGKQNGIATNKMFEYDLKTGSLKELASIPGEEKRTQAVTQILNDNLYVFSGGDTLAYTDGYKYDFETNTWSSVANVEVDGKEISLLGANSIKINENEMIVIGGFNKEVWDNNNKIVSLLKGKELDEYKIQYFTQDPLQFNWNRKILVYDSKLNKWDSLGELPFEAPCGEALVLIQNKIFSINGEIKPGVRTDRMYIGTIYKN